MLPALSTPSVSSADLSARVLVVEDDLTCLKFVERVLTGRGYALTLARDLESARQALRGMRFDVIVTDLQLPDGQGLALLQEVVTAQGSVAAIVMTGFPSVGTAVDALRLEVLDYVIKPVVDIDERVARVLHRARAREAGGAELARRLRLLADQIDQAEASEGSCARGSPRTPAPPDPWQLLSPRETAVAKLLVSGAASAQIARDLGVSLNTVRNHLQSAFKKLGARSQLELVARLTGRLS